jgi:pilus assembly protein CpaC
MGGVGTRRNAVSGWSSLSAFLILLLALVGIAMPRPAALAQEVFIQFRDGRGLGEVDVPVGQSITVQTEATIGELVVGDTEVADVFPLTENSLYILGKMVGRTNIAVYDLERRLLGVIDVEVGVDVADLDTALRQAAPGAEIEVQTVNGRLRLSGSVPDAVTLDRVLEIARQYSENVINAIQVTKAQQVMLQVRLLEASRTAGRELGISWRIDEVSTLGGGFSPAPRNSLLSGEAPFGNILAQILDAGIDADILIQALEAKGLARRLAEPNLVALSGESASFLAGGEVPIPVAQDDNRVTIEFKRFGVQLIFTPVVLGDSLINLKLETEVSEVDPTTTLRLQDIEIPAFTTRNAVTTLELRDGQSFAMAGLLQTVHTKNQRQLPWLGQVPVLGALFRSSNFQKQETDLVIIVTPALVRPASPDEPLATPLDAARPSNDAEFFLLGMQEVDEDMLRRFAEGAGIYGPYGHIIELPEGAYVVQTKP